MKKLLFILLFAIGASYWGWGQTYHNLSSGAFTQNWANTGMITLSDNWTGVASIIGYRGDDITASTGVDPQTLLGEGTITIDVNANQLAPNTYTTGGLTEFEISDPVVAFQGSGTADAPNLIIYLNSTGVTNIQVQYNLRDIDGSADNAIQQVALQYRVGTIGNFTNIPAGYVADASTGPSLATLVTPVNVTLPVGAENQSQLQLRIMTTNAVGTDEWIGMDDINISGTVSSSSATQLAITSINGGISPSTNTTFNVTVQSQDATNAPANVTANTDFLLSLATGSGSLGGTLTGTILAGTNTAIVTGVTYNTAESGVSITATVTAGDPLTPGTSSLFTVLQAADHLAFVNVPPYGLINTNLVPFTVEARRPDNSVDANYTGNVTVSKASGAGNLSGTTIKPAVSGIATFNDLKFDAADTYTLNAASGTLTSATSGNITILGAITAYRTKAGGTWNVWSTWEAYAGSVWFDAFDYPASSSADVTIRTGHTVFVTDNNGKFNDLTVEIGGKVWVGTTTSRFLYAYGDITCDGTIGDAGGTDGLGFDIEGASCMISGSGLFIISRMAKYTTASTTTDLTFDIDASLMYAHASNSALYNFNSGSTVFNITIEADKSLTVPNANIDLAGCTLTIKNNASLLEKTISGMTGTNVILERSFSGNDPDYHLFSSPVVTTTAEPFVGMYLMSFDPLPSVPYGVGNDYGYTDIVDPLTVLNVMEGYALYSDLAANTVSFTGSLNLGNQSHSFNLNGNNPYGWNLLGNPYPSSIDWDLVTIPPEMNAEVHYIDAATGADIEYIAGGGGGAGSGRYTPPMQGFFVSALSAGTLQLTNACRTHTDADTYNKSEINDLLVLQVAGNGFTNETRIYFNEEATNEHDRLFDAYKIVTSSNPLLPQIYSITPTDVKLGINGLPEVSLIPVGMIAGSPGEYTISAIETSEFENVVLEDLVEGTKTNLLTGSYTFTTGINEPENRFIVHFTPMAVPENVAELINVWSSGNEIKVNAPAGTNGLIHVYNVMGQEIATSAISGNTTSIPVNNNACYVVKVMAENSVVTRKVFVK